jgi:hypothetical protein
MNTFPKTTISRQDNSPKENGASVYAIWRCIDTQNMMVKGFIRKSRDGKWLVDIATRYYGQRVDTYKTLAEAKTVAKNYLY